MFFWGGRQQLRKLINPPPQLINVRVMALCDCLAFLSLSEPTAVAGAGAGAGVMGAGGILLRAWRANASLSLAPPSWPSLSAWSTTRMGTSSVDISVFAAVAACLVCLPARVNY